MLQCIATCFIFLWENICCQIGTKFICALIQWKCNLPLDWGPWYFPVQLITSKSMSRFIRCNRLEFHSDLFSRTTSFLLDWKLFAYKMASQLLIQPAAEMHARILIIISCHERSVSAAKCAKRYPAGFPSMARVGVNLRKYVNQISIKIHKIT